MNGTIITYLPSKKYGFIKGDDGKDYFFHANEFVNKSQINMICEDAIVTFDEKATPKGYKALKCSLINASDILTFTLPEFFITSKSSVINGWDIIEYGNWIVLGHSRHSPEDAKNDAIDNAIAIGANALIDLEYYKTTGSSGNYNFSIHNFCSRAVTIAKRKSSGKYKKDDLLGLNQKAAALKESFIEKNNDTKRKQQKKKQFVYYIMSILSACFLAGAVLTQNLIFLIGIPIFCVIGGLIIISQDSYCDYDEDGSWLIRDYG